MRLLPLFFSFYFFLLSEVRSSIGKQESCACFGTAACCAGAQFGHAGGLGAGRAAGQRTASGANCSALSHTCRLSWFYKTESCGQCTPCREGSGWLWDILTRIQVGAVLFSVRCRAGGGGLLLS